MNEKLNMTHQYESIYYSHQEAYAGSVDQRQSQEVIVYSYNFDIRRVNSDDWK